LPGPSISGTLIDGPLIGVAAFLSRGSGIRIFADLLAIAICGGLFVVPLYAIVQARSAEAARARIIAAGNIVNALGMTAAALATGILIAAGLRTAQLFLVVGILNAAVALWSCKLLPGGIWRMRPRILR
jgi:acyl-[acyl-carrier-protein]-phospholipid O-acyltransferase/long-chain-fatty-acid--[acyl-carrier-protein] ligase